MPLLEWKDEFALGIPSVDHEHQELIRLVNETHEQVSREPSEFTVGDFLGEIYAKISAHFALEEKMMCEQNYDEYLDHKADHERLLDEIRDIMDYIENESEFDEETFSTKLSNWFSEHFKTKDARLHRSLG